MNQAASHLATRRGTLSCIKWKAFIGRRKPKEQIILGKDTFFYGMVGGFIRQLTSLFHQEIRMIGLKFHFGERLKLQLD